MDILCVGQLVADIIVWPVNQVDFSIDTKRVEHINIKNGGDCLNTAIGLAKLGNSVGFAGKTGNDGMGEFLLKTIKSFGIDARGLKIADDITTSMVVALVNNAGDRTFLYYGGANDKFSFEDIDIQIIDEYKAVHVGGTFCLPQFDGIGAEKLFKLAKSKGKQTSMDVTWDTTGRWLNTIKPCLKYLDIFMTSYNEAKMLTGMDKPEDMAGFLQGAGVRTVIIKLGERGSYVKAENDSFFFPAYKVNVVDTTGAGDSFVAGFLTGMAKNWDIVSCVRLATAVSAFCIQQVGATTGIPGIDEVIGFMKNNELK